VSRTQKRDGHLILRLHIGALRQQRPNHLRAAVRRGRAKRRLSVLRRRQASRSILRRKTSLQTHTHTYIQKRTHALLYARTNMHALRCTLHAFTLKYTDMSPTPLTAAELSDDTAHSGSPRTYNAEACGHTRISWRASITASDDILAGILALSRYPARPARPVILTYSSFVTPPQNQALGRHLKPQRLSIARRSNLGKSVRRAGVGTDTLHSLQRHIVDRASLWARA
jgi:hypothetical protein